MKTRKSTSVIADRIYIKHDWYFKYAQSPLFVKFILTPQKICANNQIGKR